MDMISNEYNFVFYEMKLFKRCSGINLGQNSCILGQNDKERAILKTNLKNFKPLGDDS